MDASHKDWFGSLLEDFRSAIEAQQWVNDDTIDAIVCMATIDTSYSSARQEARELPIGKVSSFITPSEPGHSHRLSGATLHDFPQNS